MRVNVTLTSDGYITQIQQAIDRNPHNTIVFHLANGEYLRKNVIDGINREIVARNRNDSFSLNYLVTIPQLQGFAKKCDAWWNRNNPKK
ncbi:hypothetical protein A2U01_0042180 [Trifolium medium]|uniref:Uncharacterized protein n=1 Tax=Trifolium medium TaxID=97028 RepID=A0A392QBT7_9FABA|nr:hypothetical protein [Trifolium medium]